eukprot:TRINITY_DN13113_c0_g4_i2.p1 TRINITY_DN13113_c0_g4~~TRINITY_DN13113_c0_g4_i2.p1  ORF type:complete len:278 (+),score=47.97 TRINITY_DN13113_c0_g4_i2:37-834(+)
MWNDNEDDYTPVLEYDDTFTVKDSKYYPELNGCTFDLSKGRYGLIEVIEDDMFLSMQDDCKMVLYTSGILGRVYDLYKVRNDQPFYLFPLQTKSLNKCFYVNVSFKYQTSGEEKWKVGKKQFLVDTGAEMTCISKAAMSVRPEEEISNEENTKKEISKEEIDIDYKLTTSKHSMVTGLGLTELDSTMIKISIDGSTYDVEATLGNRDLLGLDVLKHFQLITNGKEAILLKNKPLVGSSVPNIPGNHVKPPKVSEKNGVTILFSKK